MNRERVNANAPRSGGGDARHLASVTYPMWRIDLGRQSILLSSVTATGAIDPHGLAAYAWAMVAHAGGTPGRGRDLMALDPMRLCLRCDHH
jgi:hypothetical protein